MALTGLAADLEDAAVLGLDGERIFAQQARTQPGGQRLTNASNPDLQSHAEAPKAASGALEPAGKRNLAAQVGVFCPDGSSEAWDSLPKGLEPADRLGSLAPVAGVPDTANSPEATGAEQGGLQPDAGPDAVRAPGALAERERPRPLSCLPSAKYRVVEGPSGLALARALAAPHGAACRARAQPPPPPLCLRQRLKPLSAPLLGALTLHGRFHISDRACATAEAPSHSSWVR